MEAYITALAARMPGAPVPNDRMEDILGRIGGKPSRTRAVILRSNKIKTRHYALDPATGLPNQTNAALTAEAVRALAPAGGLDLKAIDCLACGSSSPDLMNPGLASMVHGELGLPALETASAAGICLSGITAFKFAAMNVALGMAKHAVATGSETASQVLRAGFYAAPAAEGATPEEMEAKPHLGFDADFLRWMLSDGAGAALLEGAPRKGQLSLKVEWLCQKSWAGELPTCMFRGGLKQDDGSIKPYPAFATFQQAVDANAMAIRQDVELLNREIIRVSTDLALKATLAEHPLTVAEVDWLVPHYSSNYFRERLYEGMKSAGFEVPFDRWFTNLDTKGNTGAASIFIILDELYHSGRLKAGQNILCYIPESGRFSIAWMLLKVVEA